ncbi:unnamed protein product [Staurois parvus]|uniref:Uncharacterized protein n=1 Tax=Staurois parvus TaxID=386267 RepID=A0ABN9EVK3_9NEOB|nr:unnamed protein product [Staurois parvus]
MPLRRSLIT